VTSYPDRASRAAVHMPPIPAPITATLLCGDFVELTRCDLSTEPCHVIANYK